jgi:hypothetical protein
MTARTSLNVHTTQTDGGLTEMVERLNHCSVIHPSLNKVRRRNSWCAINIKQVGQDGRGTFDNVEKIIK